MPDEEKAHPDGEERGGDCSAGVGAFASSGGTIGSFTGGSISTPVGIAIDPQ